MRRETVGGYLRAAGHRRPRAAGGRGEGGGKTGHSGRCPPTPAGKTGHHAGVSTDSPRAPPPTRAPSASACEPYRELIAEALSRGRNAMAIWQDLVDDHGFAARYASVRRFVVHAARRRAGRGARRDHHRAWRGRPSRLRRRADGARPEHRQVPPHRASSS